MIRISCIKPERVKEKLSDQTLDGMHLTYQSDLGLQVVFSYESERELEEDDIKKILKAYFQKDEIFRGLIMGVEVLD